MKKKMGRPRLSEQSAKDILIGARFGREEAEQVMGAVKKANQNKSAWVRTVLLSASKKEDR